MPRRQRARHVFGSILCPVDFSANSRAALRYGAALARRSHGLLVVLFVNDPLLVAAAAAAYDARALATTSERELRRFVTKALGASPHTRSIRFVIAIGKPARAIVKVAQDHRCDVIVMGTQGLSGPSKWFFGSVTQAVLRLTGVPVLAIPRGCRGAKAVATGVKSWPGPHIIVPIDLGDHAEGDAVHAAEVARGLGAKVTLFHVLTVDAPPSWYGPDIAAYRQREKTKAQKRLEAIRRQIPDVVEACRVTFGNPTRAISALAGNGQHSMVLLTLRGRGGLLGSRPGSTTYHVLCRSTTPVLALPPRATAARRPRSGTKRLLESVDRALARRDRLEMRAVERVLSLLPHGASTVHT
jgi:nucleotide-binding universal stress UspA family protein